MRMMAGMGVMAQRITNQGGHFNRYWRLRYQDV